MPFDLYPFINRKQFSFGGDEPEPFVPQREVYNELLNNIYTLPQREEPSGWRKLGAYVSGVGAGIKPLGIVGGQPIGASFDPQLSTATTENFAFRPYYRGMEDAAARNELLKPAAALEEGMNRSNQLLYDARENRRIAQQKADDDRWYDEQRTRTAETAEQTRRLNAETAQKRAAIQDYIARNRNKQFKTDDKGFILALDPLTGEGELVLDPTGNPIKSSEATDAQREQMRLNTALKVEAARTVGDVKVVEARGAQDRATEAARPVRPSSSASGATSELEKTRAIVNRANNARNKYPELAKWIKIDGTNVSITPPSTGGIFSRGPSTAEHAKLYGEIYGPVINRSNTVGGDNAAPAGKVKVINSQGQEGYIPASQLEAALAQGYRKAQ